MKFAFHKWASCVPLLAALLPTTVQSQGCPFVERQTSNPNMIAAEDYLAAAHGHPTHFQRMMEEHQTEDHGEMEHEVPDYQAVMDEIEKLLTQSQDFWPGDFADTEYGPHYGGLFIRLAWHCAGSYRESDGRGGCDGGRIRFAPELEWPDNGNLDMALKLLEPIKETFGDSLSWGDLIILSGTTAIKAMGGPFLGFCGGRVDDMDGAASLILGPSDIQEELTPCVSVGMQGRCLSPLGPTTVGLIYVNPEGPVGATGDQEASGIDIRNAFARMGFNDTESVALIGGGHAFGKAHGACPPEEAPCGEGELQGKGPNTLTSGLEGKWTLTPTVWTNDFFINMFDLEWEQTTSPAGALQWKPAGNVTDDIFMLTSDLALAADPDYRVISEGFKNDITSLETQFAAAWYRLTTADMGPATRCVGNFVPPPQGFQYTLPSAPDNDIDYKLVYDKIAAMIEMDKATHIAAFTNLAFQCASTFRSTDFQGGCNGARIMMEPQVSWPGNEGVMDVIASLKPVQEVYPEASMSDLIVLAGQVAVEMAGGKSMPFCAGRVDATDGGPEFLAPRIYDPALLTVRDWCQVSGFTPEECVALFARPTGETFSNQYFVDLKEGTGDSSPLALALLSDEFVSIVDMYAADNDKFTEMFSVAWAKLMTADRFDGPYKNACKGVNDLEMASSIEDPPSNSDGAAEVITDAASGKLPVISFVAVVVGAFAMFL